MEANFISKFVEETIKAGFATRNQLVGCTQEEISALEATKGVTLPARYKDFLMTMGHCAGSLFRGTDVFYDDLFDLRSQLEDILHSDGLFVLTPDSFVFSGHQGCIFHFFKTNPNNDNPPVSGYREGDHVIKEISSTFEAFLFEGLEDLKRIKDRNSLLETFNSNRRYNTKIAYEAGTAYLSKYDESDGTAESVREWMKKYEIGRRPQVNEK